MSFLKPTPASRRFFTRRAFTLLIVALFATVALAGCVSDAPADDETNGVDAGYSAGSGDEALPGEGKEIVVGMPSGWTGEMVRSHIVAKVLEDRLGYDVTIKSLGAGPIYKGLQSGDVDLFVGAWLPLQQEHYEAVQDDVVILGDNLPSDAVGLYLAVPKYLADQGITTIADLDANKEMFDGTITGIEAGAGMMMTAQDRMDNWDIYGLGDWTLQASSTGAMLAAYDTAVANKEPIVVTIWKPHYAYAKWQGDNQMVNLEDPGYEVDGETKYFYKDQTEAAKIQTLATKGFEAEHPEAAAFLKNFQVPGDHENAYMLEVNQLSEEGAKEPTKDVAHTYVENHQELVDSWFN